MTRSVSKYSIGILLFSFTAMACVEVPPTYIVPRSFVIHVGNGRAPVVGLKLRVTRFKSKEFLSLTAEQQRTANPEQFVQVIAESSTDGSGEAHFNIATPGDFDVSPDYPGVDGFAISIHVSDNAKTTPVQVEWPSHILETKRLGGQIHEGRNEPLEARLSLRRLVSYEEVAATMMAKDGSFEFADVPSGLYFVRVKAIEGSPNTAYREGDIPIFVTQGAAQEQLSIIVDFTECGLSYHLR